jgi:carbonic anhydrase
MAIRSRVRVAMTALLATAMVACASGPGATSRASTGADTGPCAALAAQSPIAIDPTAAVPGTIGAPDIRYTPTAIVLWNKGGHTLQADYAPGSGNSILLDGVRFDLVEFHFHWPKEHPIVGLDAAMELHLVHADERGNLAVLGVPIVVGGDGKGALDELFAAIPSGTGWRSLPSRPFDANRLRPDTSTRLLRYPGSLTTSPFTECVRWVVYDRALAVSAQGLDAYKARFPHPYSHPPQPLNGRVPVRVGG